MLKADQFQFSNTYKNKLEYKSLESKVNKSILPNYLKKDII